MLGLVQDEVPQRPLAEPAETPVAAFRVSGTGAPTWQWSRFGGRIWPVLQGAIGNDCMRLAGTLSREVDDPEKALNAVLVARVSRSEGDRGST